MGVSSKRGANMPSKQMKPLNSSGTWAPDVVTFEAICDQAQTQAEHGLHIYKHVVKNLDGYDKNALLSPAGIAMALAMTAAGAEGPTLDQFLSHLKHKDAKEMRNYSRYLHHVMFSNPSNNTPGGPALGFANGLWIDERTPFSAEFARNVKADYAAEALEADFRLKAGELCKDINEWVGMRTGGKATNVLSTDVLYSHTRLMVVNALSFKGVWKEKFDSKLTAARTFHLLDGGTVAVPMMTTSRKQYIKSYSNWTATNSSHSAFSSNVNEDPWSFDNALSNSSSSSSTSGSITPRSSQSGSPVGPAFEFKVLKLPYRRPSRSGKDCPVLSMYVFLPDNRDGLPELERDLDAAWMATELPLLTRVEPVGEFLLPKFQASFSFQVNGALQGLGLTLPFSERKADFSAMLDDEENSGRVPTGCFCYGLGKKSRPLALSSVTHESVVEVSEEGGAESEAISSKVVGLTRYNSIDPLYKYNFVADHPFLYVIRDDTTGLIFFIGRVTNPKPDVVPLLDL